MHARELTRSCICWFVQNNLRFPLVLGRRLFTTIRFHNLQTWGFHDTHRSHIQSHKISNAIRDLLCSGLIIALWPCERLKSSLLLFFCTITLVGATVPIHEVLMQICAANLCRKFVPLWNASFLEHSWHLAFLCSLSFVKYWQTSDLWLAEESADSIELLLTLAIIHPLNQTCYLVSIF